MIEGGNRVDSSSLVIPEWLPGIIWLHKGSATLTAFAALTGAIVELLFQFR